MRIVDIAVDQRKNIVPLDHKSGLVAIIPPKLPRSLDFSDVMPEIEQCIFAQGTFATEMLEGSASNKLARLLFCREAAIAGQVAFQHLSLADILLQCCLPSEEFDEKGWSRLPRNFFKALNTGISLAAAEGRKAFTAKNILELHAIVAAGLSDFGQPSSFRARQTWIKGHRIETARLVPPPPDRITECMEDLIEFMALDTEKRMPTVVRAALVACQMRAIQPFSIRGTELVTAIITPMMAVADNMPPVLMGGYLRDNGRTLVEAQAEQQLAGSWVPWLRFFLYGYSESIRQSIVLVSGIKKAQMQWMDTIEDFRADSAVHKIVGSLPQIPAFSVQSLQRELGLSFQTANTAVLHLLKLGIIRPVGHNKRNRLFIADEIVRILEDGELV